MVMNYKPRADRAPDDGALVTRVLEELDKGKSLRDVSNRQSLQCHFPKSTLRMICWKELQHLRLDWAQQQDG